MDRSENGVYGQELVREGKWKGEDKIEAAKWLRSKLSETKQSALKRHQKEKLKGRLGQIESWLKGE